VCALTILIVAAAFFAAWLAVWFWISNYLKSTTLLLLFWGSLFGILAYPNWLGHKMGAFLISTAGHLDELLHQFF
jgi:hypothetical protein